MIRQAFPALVVAAAAIVVGTLTTVRSTAAPLARCGPGRFVRDTPGPGDPIRAYFARRSYAPGERAVLHVAAFPGRLTVGIFHVGPEGGRIVYGDTMTGVPVRGPTTITWSGRVGTLTLSVSDWPTGYYFARVSAGAGQVGFAPFVLRPTRLGTSRVAVVLPTNTWQAYNFLDQNNDGYGDTWYADPRVSSVRLDRPYLHHGVPPQREGFFRWASHTGKQADYLSDDDLEQVGNARALARRYDLIVFAGHEEYITGHVFDLIRGYRDLGGNIAFLSANSFFGRVERHHNEIVCIHHFRDEGRPESSLLGAQYLDWWRNQYPSRPYLVTGAQVARWFYNGTGLRNGDHFGSAYGVEIDTRTAASPPTTKVLAALPNIFGPGKTGEMTYYQTPAGAKVFDAGAFNFAGPQSPITERLLNNLWHWLSKP